MTVKLLKPSGVTTKFVFTLASLSPQNETVSQNSGTPTYQKTVPRTAVGIGVRSFTLGNFTAQNGLAAKKIVSAEPSTGVFWGLKVGFYTESEALCLTMLGILAIDHCVTMSCFQKNPVHFEQHFRSTERIVEANEKLRFFARFLKDKYRLSKSSNFAIGTRHRSVLHTSRSLNGNVPIIMATHAAKIFGSVLLTKFARIICFWHGMPSLQAGC